MDCPPLFKSIKFCSLSFESVVRVGYSPADIVTLNCLNQLNHSVFTIIVSVSCWGIALASSVMSVYLWILPIKKIKIKICLHVEAFIHTDSSGTLVY